MILNCLTQFKNYLLKVSQNSKCQTKCKVPKCPSSKISLFHSPSFVKPFFPFSLSTSPFPSFVKPFHHSQSNHREPLFILHSQSNPVSLHCCFSPFSTSSLSQISAQKGTRTQSSILHSQLI